MSDSDNLETESEQPPAKKAKSHIDTLSSHQVNNNKKERQKRYREQNKNKLKQREAERRKCIQNSQSIGRPRTSSNTNIELNNVGIITAISQSSSGLAKTQPSYIRRNEQDDKEMWSRQEIESDVDFSLLVEVKLEEETNVYTPELEPPSNTEEESNDYEIDLKTKLLSDEKKIYKKIDDVYYPSEEKKVQSNQESVVEPAKCGTPTNGTNAEEVAKHLVEIVTINEEERQLEHRELFSARQHMRYICEQCALGFVVEDAYLMHMKVHSPESGMHECDICHSWLKSADVLYRHRLRHYRRYRCGICHTRYKDKDTAAFHVMTDHAGQAFMCSHCGKGFNTNTVQIKPSTQRSRMYRARQKLLQLSGSSADKQRTKVQVKSSTQRSREHRARQKLLRVSESSADKQCATKKKKI